MSKANSDIKPWGGKPLKILIWSLIAVTALFLLAVVFGFPVSREIRVWVDICLFSGIGILALGDTIKLLFKEKS